MKIFQVTFKIKSADERFWQNVPEHRAMVMRLLQDDVLLTYAVAADRETGWATARCDSEEELLETLKQSPLSPWLEYRIDELMLYDNPALHFPRVGLN